MELNIDTGVEEFRVNGRGVLRFNPADPNLYHRFFAVKILVLNAKEVLHLFRIIFLPKARCGSARI